VTFDGQTIPVPADKPTLDYLAQQTGGSFHTATSAQELKSVYANIGTQIGFTTVHRDISWRFLAVGLLFALASAGTSMLWAGRLI
jgi:Ca-activated chloride channel family protein